MKARLLKRNTNTTTSINLDKVIIENAINSARSTARWCISRRNTEVIDIDEDGTVICAFNSH
jgi:hypothetical protein